MSVSSAWPGDRDGFVAGDLQTSVGHDLPGAGRQHHEHHESAKGQGGRDKHQQLHPFSSTTLPYGHNHNHHPHRYNYIHDASTRTEEEEEEAREEEARDSYPTSTAEPESLPTAAHNPSASFFPELSLSPSPEPESNTNQRINSRASSVSLDSESSFASTDTHDLSYSFQPSFSGLGPPLLGTFQHTSAQFQQQTANPPLKRKRGRPPKNLTASAKPRRHQFTTFNNGFAMTFTAEDDYRVVGEDEYETDGAVGRPPIQQAITLDPLKRAERQRASNAASASITAAATRGRRQVATPAASTVPVPKKESAGKGKATRASLAQATSDSDGGRTPSRAKRGTGKDTPKYKVEYSDEDQDGEDDEVGDHDNDHDDFSGPSNSDTSGDDSEEKGGNDDDVHEDNRPERITSAGHSLRARKDLTQPDRLKEYVSVDSALGLQGKRKPTNNQRQSHGKHSQKYKRLGKGMSCQHCHDKRIRCDGNKPQCGNCVKYKCDCISRIWNNGKAEVQSGDAIPKEDRQELTPVKIPRDKTITTQRQDMRLAIQEGTTKKRHNFFRAYSHLFTPLLPERNFITKLKETEQFQKESKLEAKNENEDGEGDIEMGEESVKQETLAEAIEGNAKYNVEEERKQEAVPYELLEKQPSGVKATMKPYQIAGLSFLLWLYNNGASGLLGDEMGLGKTLQTLSLFSYLTEHHPSPPGHHRPFLVVCPLSVLSSWMTECKRWTPHLRPMRFHGPVIEKERMKKLAEFGELDDDGVTVHPFDVVITTYEVFEKEVTWFRRAFVWRYVVLDEGHKIKNELTNISQALQGLTAEYRLVLTGTPLQNNLKELWALLHFILPEVFTTNTQTKFTNAFNLTLGKVDKSVMDNSRQLLELIMLRRMKDSKGVNLGLPPKKEVVLALPLTPMQRFWYRRLLTRLDKGLLEDLFKGAKDKEEAALIDEREVLRAEEEQLAKVEEGLESFNPETMGDSWIEAKTIMEQSIKAKTTGWQKLMNLLMQLRKCCNHPYMLPGAAPEPYFTGTHLMLASSKFIILDRLIDELCIKQGRKVLIFSGFTRMLDIVEEFLSLKGGDGEKFHYSRLDGTTCRARRNLEIRLFNADERYKVMLLSTRAGGLGINLATASDVVMLESDWNPQADLQAQARAHRIGQANEVTVYRLITQGTVEEQMMGRIRKKLYLSAKVTESMRDIHSTQAITPGKKGGRGRPKVSDEGDDLPNLTAGQLMSLVRRGAQAIAKPEIDPEDMLKWDWEEMVNRTKDYEMTLEPNDQQGKKKAAQGQAGEKKDVEVLAPGVAVVAEEDLELKWLSEMEKVETRLFEGREHKKREEEEHAQLILDITRDSRRDGKNRVVMIDGHAVLKETVGCGEWEAVATISGKGANGFTEPPKKKKESFEHQDYCQVCYDGGTISLCQGCPRSYHVTCLPPSYKSKVKATLLGGFYCPQHQCTDCEQKTTNAGGMLFRCRWCDNAYCEDCMDWDETKLIGDGLVEMELLGYPERGNTYWIKCVHCIEQHKENPEYEKMCADMEKEWEEEMAERRKKEAEEKHIQESVEQEGEKSGVETPVSGGLGGSLESTGVTTTAATSVGSDEDDLEDKVIPKDEDTDTVPAVSSRSASQASSRTPKRAAKSKPVTYAVKRSYEKQAKSSKIPTSNAKDVLPPSAVKRTVPIAGTKRKEESAGQELATVKRRR